MADSIPGTHVKVEGEHGFQVVCRLPRSATAARAGTYTHHACKIETESKEIFI